jgi:hypothetical protein
MKSERFQQLMRDAELLMKHEGPNVEFKPPIPDDVRREVIKRAHGKCEECGRREPLELHHRTYTHPCFDWGDHSLPIFGLETTDNLVALCRECHRSRHVGPDDVFYADPEECAAEWDYYDHFMEG